MGKNAYTASSRIGSVTISDASENYWPSEADIPQSWNNNNFSARFYYGFRFSTGVTGNNYIGVQLLHGATSWSSICDVNLKENFEVVNGKSVLEKLDKIPLTSWNYKGQDPLTFRHYGIMAQDFYQAFGQDAYGTIGCDTLVNPIDLLGVAYAAIKELSLQIKELKIENESLKTVAQLLESKNENAIRTQENSKAELSQRIAALETNLELLMSEMRKTQ
jgi:hypothetical protein